MNRPLRGEVWLADCGMTAKIRPVVVISILFKGSDRALITVVPHTTQIIGSEFEVPLPLPWLKSGAFNVQAVFPLSPPRFIRRLGNLSPEQIGQIETTLRRWQGLA